MEHFIDNLETLLNTFAALFVGGTVHLITDTVRKRGWKPLAYVSFSVMLMTMSYGSLLMSYTYLISPSVTWRSFFYPETVAIEGYWLETKKFTNGLGQSQVGSEDVSIFPYTILAIRYDRNAVGHFVVEGVSVSQDDAINFKSLAVWSMRENLELYFTYVAKLGGGLSASGLTTITFHYSPKYEFTKGFGNFVDERGVSVDFDLKKIPEVVDEFDLSDPDQRIGYLRSLEAKKPND